MFVALLAFLFVASNADYESHCVMGIVDTPRKDKGWMSFRSCRSDAGWQSGTFVHGNGPAKNGHCYIYDSKLSVQTLDSAQKVSTDAWRTCTVTKWIPTPHEERSVGYFGMEGQERSVGYFGMEGQAREEAVGKGYLPPPHLDGESAVSFGSWGRSTINCQGACAAGFACHSRSGQCRRNGHMLDPIYDCTGTCAPGYTCRRDGFCRKIGNAAREEAVGKGHLPLPHLETAVGSVHKVGDRACSAAEEAEKCFTWQDKACICPGCAEGEYQVYASPAFPMGCAPKMDGETAVGPWRYEETAVGPWRYEETAVGPWRYEASTVASTTPSSSGPSTLIRVFAALGLAISCYGAFRHYVK